MNEYHLFLKGTKDPIVISSEKYKKIADVFFDSSIKSDFVIRMGDLLFRKGEIRTMREANERSNLGSRPHWIIVNHKRNSIWKDVFNSYEAAKIEFDYQISRLAKNQKHNFSIEARGNQDNYRDPFKEFALPAEQA